MKYLSILVFWCIINFIFTLAGWKHGFDMFKLNMYFFAGVFLIIIYGFFELNQKQKDLRTYFNLNKRGEKR